MRRSVARGMTRVETRESRQQPAEMVWKTPSLVAATAMSFC